MTIGLFFMATYTRMTRASMLEVKRLDFVKTARGKGLGDDLIQRRHVLRNALLPVVTLGGLAYAQLLTGTVLTESIFSWPGLGRYTFQSAVRLDFPAIMGITLVVAAIYVMVKAMPWNWARFHKSADYN